MPKYSVRLRVATALALVLVLAGCTKGGQFDPTEIFNNDAFDTKKKLKGEREAVFPNGVPGTTTGVPADLVKGYQPPPDAPDADAAVPRPAPPSATEVAAKPKPKPKPKVASNHQPTRISIGAKPSTAQQAAPAQQSSQSVWPNPPSTSQQSQTAWPNSPSTAPAQQSQSQSVWPNPPPTGTKTQ